MTLAVSHRALLIRLGKIIAFAAAVLVTTKLTLQFGTLTSTPTAAFCFLIIVLLSAFFGDLTVAITTSLVATLCFDYFYLPPAGTLNIAAFADWVSLAAFLLASVIISRLTASAAVNGVRADALERTVVQLREFGKFLLSIPHAELTLSGVAKEALRIFTLEYCSIHVYGEGKWQHYTGSAASSVPEEIENRLKSLQDHPRDLMELADENVMGVRYVQINEGKTPLALLAVRSRTLPVDAIGTIAYMIGVRLSMTTKN
jgi:two-component system, OmpR family, sensor histidine kinase KdpD